MKKKLLATVLSICTVALAVFAFTACGTTSATPGKNVNIDVSVSFTASKDVMALTEKTSMKDYMDALADKGELAFEYDNGEYGAFITSVYGVKSGDNSFWAVYTDLVKIDGDDAVYSSSEWGTVELNGKTLNGASVGVSGLPCVEGYTYALVYTAF